jgi:hypothetical protein
MVLDLLEKNSYYPGTGVSSILTCSCQLGTSIRSIFQLSCTCLVLVSGHTDPVGSLITGPIPDYIRLQVWCPGYRRKRGSVLALGFRDLTASGGLDSVDDSCRTAMHSAVGDAAIRTFNTHWK